jgi:hypothetical protein
MRERAKQQMPMVLLLLAMVLSDNLSNAWIQNLSQK